MRDCLLLVDVFNDFSHEDGEELFASFEGRLPALRELVRTCRQRGVPVVYANDPGDVFDGDCRAIVERARKGPAGEGIDDIAPLEGDSFVVKPRYSAFEYTPLELILERLGTDRLILAGMSTEGCVAQTAIAARERGLKVTIEASACATVHPELEETALEYLTRVVGVRLEGDVDRSARAARTG